MGIGFLCCATCKEGVLGKWLRDDDGGCVGFWHGPLCPAGIADSPALGRKVLRFLARHMDHDLLAASDEGGRADAIIEEVTTAMPTANTTRGRCGPMPDEALRRIRSASRRIPA